MKSGGELRRRAGFGLAMALGWGLTSPAQAGEDECSIRLRAGRAERAAAQTARTNGDAEGLLEHLEKARDAFAKAMKACPDSARSSWSQVESQLAYRHYQDKHFEDACDAYAELLEVSPGRSLDRALYADALEQSGRFQEAVDQFHTLIQAEPSNHATFYCNMAMIYALDLGDGPQAVEAVRKGMVAGVPTEPCLQFAWGIGLETCGVDLMETGEADRGLPLLQESKAKFSALLDDPDYGARARAEVKRLDERIDQGERSRKTREKR